MVRENEASEVFGHGPRGPPTKTFDSCLVLSFHYVHVQVVYGRENQTHIFVMDAEAIAVEKLDIDDEKIEIDKVTEIKKPTWATCGW